MRTRVAIITPGGIGAGYFSQGYPPLLNFIQKLSNEYDITVYSIHAINPDFVAKNFKLRSIPSYIKPSKLRSLILFVMFLFDHFKFSYKLIHAFWVYPAGTIGVILGKLINIPNIVTIQGGEAAYLPQIGYGNMINSTVKRITLWTCQKTTCLNSISEFLILEMKKHGLKRSDHVTIPFGPERTLFSEMKKDKDKDLLKIIHVANLNEVKDQVTLLKAFDIIRKHRPAQLRIVGDGILYQKLNTLAVEMQLNDCVVFLGAIPNIDLPHHYAWADVMMHTSLHEGQSGVVMEAMSSGVVVCGTCVGILYDLGEKYFVTVDVGDYKALADRVLKIWEDDNCFNMLKENSLRWVLKYDADWTAREYSSLYKRLFK